MYVLGMLVTLTFSLITFEVKAPYLEWWQYAYILLILLVAALGAVILLCYGYFDTKLWLWAEGRKTQAREVIRRIYRNPGSVPREATLSSREVQWEQETKKPLWLGFSEL